MLASITPRRCGALLLFVAVSALPQSVSAYAPPSAVAPAAAIETAPYAGYVNHAHLAPSFRWGWFGAERFHPRVNWHRGYNGELYRWATYRRY